MEIGFLREQRYQSSIVQLVRDEFQPKEREFYQLLQIVVPRLMLDNFDFIPFPKKLLFQMQVSSFLAKFLILNAQEGFKNVKYLQKDKKKKTPKRSFSSKKFNKQSLRYKMQ